MTSDSIVKSMILKQPPKPSSCTNVSDLVPWLQRAIAQPQADLQLKLRGNILHVLCQTPTPIKLEAVLFRAVEFLVKPDHRDYLQTYFPEIYQIYFYSRLIGQSRPDWTAPIFLNRLERHLMQLSMVLGEALTAPEKEDISPNASAATNATRVQNLNSAIVMGNLSLARKGDPDAIAHYLTETLSTLGVGVWVSARAVPGRAKVSEPIRDSLNRPDLKPSTDSPPIDAASQSSPSSQTIPRLWILCEAAYSPDANLIADPTAQLLRNLKLTQFRDAVVLVQVTGEERLDWMLRIDLTPPEEMLRDWARWGDEESIGRLLDQALADLKTSVSATLKDSSLHLVCQPQATAKNLTLPPQVPVLDKLLPYLETLAPQGLHRAMIYGQERENPAPAWVKCIDLPAAEHPALAEAPLGLAQQGDLGALTFLISRLLNPDLAERLTTGGIRVQLLTRDKLLHVMLDAPVCPPRRLVAQKLTKWLRQVHPKTAEGVRLYGRRAGQKQPAWSYGIDFKARDRKVIPAATPEFAASDAYVGDLLTPTDEPAHRSDLTPQDLKTLLRSLGRRTLSGIRAGLLKSQLFIDQAEADSLANISPRLGRRGIGVALLWGMAGVLIAVQADWVLGQLLNPPSPAATAEAQVNSDETAEEPIVAESPENDSTSNDNQDDLSDLAFGRSADDDITGEDDFIQDGFTGFPSDSSFTDDAALDAADADRAFVSLSALLAESPYPSFKSKQMDEKLALYHQRLKESGPPDVLILGSSRALRGVDPAVLRRDLAVLGYGDLDIFNFGINGSTAQVVDFTLRELLQSNQLPKLIIWADGARALNSGRVDITYNAIEVSEGYRALLSGQLTQSGDGEAVETAAESSDLATTNPLTPLPGEARRTLRESYQAVDRWLSEQIAQVSTVHGDRERLKTALRATTATVLETMVPGSEIPSELAVGSAKLDADGLVVQDTNLIDFDGFLSLSVEFNPATYYQDHARVSGDYDGDYEDFRLAGRQAEALEQLLDFTQSLDIPVVFVNTPLTNIYLDAYRTQAEAEFLRYMLRLSATRKGFVFRDFGKLWLEQYDYFSDPSHLNRYGAYQVSSRLAEDPMISWSELEETETP